MGRQLTLALCMIVRDEADMLPGLLASVDGLWDELCVVDTGSNDGTRQLLRDAGAKVVELPWEDDFAAARNASLELATSDWILVLDADERVSPELAASLRAVLEVPEVGAASLRVRSDFDGGHHRDSVLLRMFRNEGIRYRYRIHEDCTPSVAAMLLSTGRIPAVLDGTLEHLGYTRDRAAARDKLARDRRMLQAAIAEDPADLYSRFKLLELARFWADDELGAEAAAEVLEGLEAGRLSLARDPHGGELVAMLAGALHPDDPTSALTLLQRFAEDCEGSPALWLARGELREICGNPMAAAEDFERCLAAEDPTLQRTTTRPLLGLARLALAAGDGASAADRVEEALRGARSDPEALLAGLALAIQTDLNTAEEFLREYTVPPELIAEAIVGVGKGRVLDGRVEEARTLMGAFVAAAPVAGIGVLVCDLLLGDDSDIELDLEQHEADDALLGWFEALTHSPRQLHRFVEVAPALVPAFPWLVELLEDDG
ncbi:MAG: glycosyltransferase family 2 protein [Proteobacteria bacterium]|nr:glycosyltransferase family 2 protein [Pseudomonadota bacterium]